MGRPDRDDSESEPREDSRDPLLPLLERMARPPETAFAPGAWLGRYRIVSFVDRGGMGEVYRAHDERLGRDVAIKVVRSGERASPALQKRFETEAKAVGSLNHPNVVAVFDAGEQDGCPYLVTELLDGETLAQRLRGGALTPTAAVEVALGIARGLAAAHAVGVVHRDLKPSNVFLTKDGGVKVLDFGLAKLVGDGSSMREPVTETGAILGTVEYMSPEQVRGQPADPRSDVFSFGAVLYEMLSGSRAFGGKSDVETGYAIVNDEPRAVPAGTPRRLARLIARCLAKKPEDRFQFGGELVGSLAAPSGRAGRAARRMEAGGLMAELKRRRVFHALVGYGIAAFAVLQIVEPIMHGLRWPDEVLTYVVVALAAGFPVVVSLAWIFDVKATGIDRTPPMPNLRRRRVAVALIAIGVLASAPGLVWYLVLRKPAQPASAGTTATTSGPQRRRVPIGNSPSRGPADAPVTIVEFGDFQCPSSRQAEPMLRRLFQKYPDKIRLVWKDEPLGVHLDADDAASLAREALRQKGPDAFWRVHDKLFAAAPRLGRPVLERIAVGEGLDIGAVTTALREGRYRAAIDADVDLVDAISKTGTPTFFINGRAAFTDDADALEKLLEKGVAEELAEARRRIVAGVPAAALYDDVQRDAESTPLPPERVKLPDPGGRPARGGPAQSALLVHEFCDLSLVWCAWIEPQLRRTLASYGDEVRLVWWDVSDPQQQNSARVMKAATSAGNDAFWKMHDAILARQWREGFEEPPPETLSAARLRQLAQEIGVDMAVYDYAIATGLREHEKRQLAEARSLMPRSGRIVIDDEVYGSGAPPHLWRSAIDRALARRR